MLLSVGANGSLAGSTVTTGYGWLVPLLAAVVSGLVGWALLRDSALRSDRCEWKFTGFTCPSCGGSVRTDWRLCPHCGNRMPLN
jgi:hypothetical protein